MNIGGRFILNTDLCNRRRAGVRWATDSDTGERQVADVRHISNVNSVYDAVEDVYNCASIVGIARLSTTFQILPFPSLLSSCLLLMIF